MAKHVKRNNVYYYNPEDLTVVTDKGHPLYDERATKPLDEALVNSVIADGILQNVLVTKDGDDLLVVAGRQRVRAAYEANQRLSSDDVKVLVPTLITRGDEITLEGKAITENEIRTDDDVLTKANKVQRFLDRGATEEDASRVFGVTKVCIGNWLKVLELSPKVQKAIKNGDIAYTRALKLHGLSHKEQNERLSEGTSPDQGGGEDEGGSPTPRKRNKKQVRGTRAPSKKKVRKVIEAESTPEEVRMALQWAVGDLSLEEVADSIVGFPADL